MLRRSCIEKLGTVRLLAILPLGVCKYTTAKRYNRRKLEGEAGEGATGDRGLAIGDH